MTSAAAPLADDSAVGGGTSRASAWRTETAPRAWKLYVWAVVLAGVPFFVQGFAMLLDAPVSAGLLAALFVMLIAGNVCALELPPYRFLHLTSGWILFSGYFLAGPPILALLALSLKPSEMIARRLSRYVYLEPSQHLGGEPAEYAVPTVTAAIAIGVVHALRDVVGLAYPFRPVDLGDELVFFGILAFIYVTFVAGTELGIVLRFGARRVYGSRLGRADLLVYLLAMSLGAPVVWAVVHIWAPDFLHTIFALGWLLWGFVAFFIAAILVRRGIEVRRLVRAMAHQQRLAALGSLASVIAHQTRHHLGILSMSAYVLEDALAKEHLTESARKAVRKELEAIARTRDELEELLTSELENDAREDRFGLASLARECAHDLEPLATECDVSWRFEGEDRTIRGDRLRLKQAVTNLLRNAVEAAPGGSEVWVRVNADDAGVRLSVRDRGPGLSPESRDRLFEPLFSEKPNGLGMGLFVARRIVEAHGGRVTLLDTGEGTQAEIHLEAGY